MYTILILIFIILYAYLSYKRHSWAIFVIIATLPSYAVRFNIFHIPMTLLETMILVIFIIWLFKKNSKVSPSHKKNSCPPREERMISKKNSKFKSEIPSYFLPIIIFLIAATIGIFVSPNTQAALGIWKAYFIEPVLFLIVFIDFFKDKKTTVFNFIAQALAIPALYISIFAVYQKFTGTLVPSEFWQPGYHRVTSFFSYPNAIGLLLAPIAVILLCAAIYHFIKKSRDQKKIISIVLLASTAIFSILAIIFAKSEGAIIALIIGAIFFLFFYNKKTRIIISATLLTSIIILSILFILNRKKWDKLFNETYFFNLDTVCETNPCTIYQKLTLQDISGTIRRQMWRESFSMLKEKPLFGAGLAAYQKTISPYRSQNYIETYLYPHNIFLNFYSEIGLLGLISFIWLIILFFIYGIKIYKSAKEENRLLILALMASMIVLLTHGMVDVPYFKNDLAVLFWILYGAMLLNLT